MAHAPRDGFAVVRMLIPLSEPVAVPGTVWRCFFSENRMPSYAYIGGRAREYEDGQELFPQDWKNGEFLIRVHEGISGGGFLSDLRNQLDLAVAKWNADLMEGVASVVDKGLAHEVTWIKVVAVRGVGLDCEECGNQAVNDATRAVLSVTYAIQAAHSYAKNQAISLITAETVQRWVPIQITRCNVSEEVVHRTGTYVAMPYLMMPRLHLSYEEKSSLNASTAKAPVLRSLSEGRIFSRHFELVAEAVEAVYLRGQPSQALMVAAQACEYLLDTVLFFMMWWDGLKPKDGAREFEATSNLIFARVKGCYEVRLGRDWTPDEGPLARWRDAVVRPRNRVIHGGSRVSMAEAEEALEVSRDLRGFLADLAAEPANVRRYRPLRALLMGDELLPGGWVGMREEEFYNYPGYPADRFRAWVALLQGELALSTRPKEASAHVLAVANRNGGFEWWLFDPDSHKVVEVDTKSVDRGFRREMESRMRNLRQGTRRKYARVGVHPVPRVKPGAAWRSATAHGPGLPWECPWTATS